MLSFAFYFGESIESFSDLRLARSVITGSGCPPFGEEMVGCSENKSRIKNSALEAGL
jgi:hypothetical protein